MSRREKAGLKTYALFGDFGSSSGRISKSKYFNIYFSEHLFDKYFSVRAMYQNKLRIDKRAVANLMVQIYDGNYDVVYCGDSGEALLLQYIFRKNNLAPKHFLINEVDLFERAKLINRLLTLHYKEAFLDAFVGSPYNRWFYTTCSREQEYLDSGIANENLCYIPLSMPLIQLFFPGMAGLIIKNKTPVSQSEFQGRILSSGSHERDYELLVKALKGLDVRANIICNLKAYKSMASENVTWHHSLEEQKYIHAIRSAKYVVLPLASSERITGQLNCAIAMRLGKIIIAPECESLSDYLVDGETGILYEQGNVDSLRQKILFAEEHFSDIKYIGDNAQRSARRLSMIADASIKKLARALKSHLS